MIETHESTSPHVKNKRFNDLLLTQLTRNIRFEVVVISLTQLTKMYRSVIDSDKNKQSELKKM